ncbi:hypothetical protein [Helicobacter pullorum]|uniref:hypothetical protein n=1 Tax=Helicobacter pullorum TaxID=35818 RepID=UPI0008169513|nr:hypothetical protein [Helicobacter pullorum]OCR17037.1 hypothetical protein BA916_02595 [Helicobacter pullorum]
MQILNYSNYPYYNFNSKEFSNLANQDSKLENNFLVNLNSSNSTSYKEIQESNTQIETQSDEETLSKVQKNISYFHDTWSKTIKSEFEPLPYSFHTTIDMHDMNFIDTINSKLQSGANIKITQQEMQEAQDFLNDQMDNLMLKFYKANPEIVEDTLKGDFIFYSEGGLNRTMNVDDIEISRDYPELKYDKKISAILYAYGARIEQDSLDKDFMGYLQNFKNALNNQDLDDTINIKHVMSSYRHYKMESTGYSFFASLSDMLSPIEQEKITDSIAKVMGFYLQSNSMEINGIKVSWDNSGFTNDIGYYDSVFGGRSMALHTYKIDYADSQSTPNDFLASNFDTTQSIFDILNQKEKLEKENQDLKNKQAIEAYSYGNGYSSTLTSKTSKEIDSFINQMIKEAKA